MDYIYPSRSHCPWGFPGKSTGVGCHFFLQGIFQTQGSNLPALQADSLLMEPPVKPKVKSKDEDGLKFLKKIY